MYILLYMVYDEAEVHGVLRTE